MGVIRTCKRCGKALPEGVPHQTRYCAPCKEIREAEVDAAVKEKDAAKGVRRRKKSRKAREKILIDINQRAREEGLTYGEYVAKHKL